MIESAVLIVVKHILLQVTPDLMSFLLGVWWLYVFYLHEIAMIMWGAVNSFNKRLHLIKKKKSSITTDTYIRRKVFEYLKFFSIN